MLVRALALPFLPWSLAVRRSGIFTALAVAVTGLAVAVMGVSMLQSGSAGEVAVLPGYQVALTVWFWVTPFLVFRLAVAWVGDGSGAGHAAGNTVGGGDVLCVRAVRRSVVV